MERFYDGPSEIPGGGITGARLAQQEAANQAQTQQVSPMIRAAERHAKALSRLEDRLENLFRRLQVICRASTPTPANGEMKKELVNQSPLAEGLHQISDKVDSLTFRTEDILNRLEI